MQRSTIVTFQQDRLLYYASVFAYNPKARNDFKEYKPSLQSIESKFLDSALFSECDEAFNDIIFFQMLVLITLCRHNLVPFWVERQTSGFP